MAGPQFVPMSVGQILDQTFKLYKDNFVRFITIVAIAYVPIGLINTVGQSLIISGVPTEPGTFKSQPLSGTVRVEMQPGAVSMGKLAAGGIVTIVGGILSIIGYTLCTGALIKSVSEVYLGNNPTVGEAYRFVWPKVGTIIWAGLLVGLVVMLGFILLIVPGVIFSLWYCLTTQVVVVENLRASQAMGRSKNLASGNLGKIFVVFLVVVILSSIISGIIGGAGGVLFRMVTPENLMLMTLINGLFGIVGQVIALPITTAAVILLYYDLRIRKEGFDLEMLAKSMAPASAEPSA